MLHVQHVSKIYEGKVPFQALTDVSFSVEKGEFVGIMGPSGSGKTTLLNMIATIDSLTSGEIVLGGRNPHQLQEDELATFRRTELGFVFQNFHLLDTMTVEENIVLPLTLENVPVSVMEKRLQHVLKTLGMTEHRHKRTYELSGGQVQRTAVGRALIQEPSLLLADEPTGNLDSKASTDLLELLTTLNKQEAATILMVTHDPIAASFCDRVLFMKDGELFNELYRSNHRQDFYADIVNVLALLGGEKRDLSTVRFT